MRNVLTIFLFIILTNSYGQERRILKDTLGADSIVQVFYKNGQMFYQIPYRNGLQNGWSEQYHENGAIWTKEFIIDGKAIDGYYVALHDNGNIYQKGFYRHGHQIGKWFCYTSDGRPCKIYIYDKKGNWIKQRNWNEKKGKWEKSGLY